MNVRRYIFHLTLFVILLLLVVGGINYMVNPYLVFKDQRIKGLNFYKSDISNYIRQAKAYHPFNQNQKYEILLVGNSRIDMGLDPQHPFLRDKTYNIAIPGAGIELQVAYALNYSRGSGSVKTIIMGVDFTDFLPFKGTTPSLKFKHADQERLQYFVKGKRNQDFKWQRLKDVYQSTLSFDALLSSIKTLLGQSPKSSTRTYQGFNPAFDIAHSTSVEGPNNMFSQSENLLRKILKGRENYYSDATSQSSQFHSLHEIIKFSIENNIELIFFENPLHKNFMNIVVNEFGFKDDYHRWKFDIKSFITKYKDKNVRFIELEFPQSILDEEVPEKGVLTQMQWFWEPAHYKKELGNKILDLIFEHKNELVDY